MKFECEKENPKPLNYSGFNFLQLARICSRLGGRWPPFERSIPDSYLLGLRSMWIGVSPLLPAGETLKLRIIKKEGERGMVMRKPFKGYPRFGLSLTCAASRFLLRNTPILRVESHLQS